MSDRQAKIERKAAKRKAKLLAHVSSTRPDADVTIAASLADYGHAMRITATRPDGVRAAAVVFIGRKAKTKGTKLQGRLATAVFRLVARVKLSAWIMKEVDRMAFETLAGAAPAT